MPFQLDAKIGKQNSSQSSESPLLDCNVRLRHSTATCSLQRPPAMTAKHSKLQLNLKRKLNKINCVLINLFVLN